MRVIAGEFRGRRLAAPRGSVTRPTADRVREAMFSLIGPVDGLRVLDLYAGSGALAIEALSRGAAEAVLVEKSRAALAAVRENLASLGLGARAAVLACPVERAARAIRERAPFQLVLVDPPYAEIARAVKALAAIAPVIEGALVVLEHAAKDEPPAVPGAELDRTRRYGDTAVSLYRVGRRISKVEPGPPPA